MKVINNLKLSDNINALGKAFTIIVVFYLYVNYFMGIIYKLGIYSKVGYTGSLLIYSIIQLILVISMLIYAKIPIFKREDPHINLFKYITVSIILLIGLKYIPNLILLLNSNNIVLSNETGNQEKVDMVVTSIPTWLSIFSIVIVAPITEEIVFRATALFMTKRSHLLVVMLLIFTSLIFGYMHARNNLVELLAYASMGFIFGLYGYYSNNIHLPILVHIIYNFVSISNIM